MTEYDALASGCGLWAGEARIPLVGVRAQVTVSGLCERATITQRYENTSWSSIEASRIHRARQRAGSPTLTRMSSTGVGRV